MSPTAGHVWLEFYPPDELSKNTSLWWRCVRGTVEKATAKLTGGEFCHVALIWDAGNGPMCMTAWMGRNVPEIFTPLVPRGSRVRTTVVDLGCVTCNYHEDRQGSEHDFDRMESFFREQAGKEYNSTPIRTCGLSIAIEKLWWSWRSRNATCGPLGDYGGDQSDLQRREWNCVELVCRGLASGVFGTFPPEFAAMNFKAQTPNSLFETFSKIPGNETILPGNEHHPWTVGTGRVRQTLAKARASLVGI